MVTCNWMLQLDVALTTAAMTYATCKIQVTSLMHGVEREREESLEGGEGGESNRGPFG